MQGKNVHGRTGAWDFFKNLNNLAVTGLFTDAISKILHEKLTMVPPVLLILTSLGIIVSGSAG